MEVDAAPQVDAVAASEAPIDAGTNTNTPPTVRPEALHLRGVEDLGTKDIEAFMQRYHPTPFRIEWIDDSGLNIVYEDPEDAFQALVALTDHSEFDTEVAIPPEQLRKTKPHPKKADVVLEARFATTDDRKSSGSRSRSRYYLLHGEPGRKEDIVRFGTKRSQPQLYGIGKRDIVKKTRREDRSGDLFPLKEESRIALDDDMEMDDLLPHKVNNKTRRRRRGGRGRGKSSQPDLFADKLESKRDQGSNNVGDSSNASASAPGSTVYQNMDY